ncbi:HdeD family acid-resistance protein [Mycetocola miduiensis]|uniref:Uncharacterized membrane protein HdeD, DUF308 family n=1 Tax=Mycetocola miduiensis TaxID=995034 RepID=A0A1I4YNT9_9MICO|nr:DUF308 domain-containing protein [Mycetocola miduiensis]SFN39698.1 Uncharacterized membrane protein HdeD, DUF308 family [Mycetocola miduiensis]
MSFSFTVEPAQFSKSQLNGIRLALGIAGLAAVAIGIAIFVWANATLLVVAWLFGLYFVIAGLARVARSFTVPAESVGWRVLSIILGLLVLAAGVYLMINPSFGVEILAYVIGIAWIVEGVATLADSSSRASRGAAIFYAIISILGGVLIFFVPTAAIVILLKIAAIVLIIAGLVQIFQALTLGRRARAAQTA